MGTNEKLVPGELLNKRWLPPGNIREQQNFKNKTQLLTKQLAQKTNEEIANV